MKAEGLLGFNFSQVLTYDWVSETYAHYFVNRVEPCNNVWFDGIGYHSEILTKLAEQKQRSQHNPSAYIILNQSTHVADTQSIFF